MTRSRRPSMIGSIGDLRASPRLPTTRRTVITDPITETVAGSTVDPAAPVAAPPRNKPRIRRSVIAVTIAAVVLGGGAYVSAGGSAPEGAAPETSLESGFEQVPGAAVGRVADTEMFAAVLADDDMIRVYL